MATSCLDREQRAGLPQGVVCGLSRTLGSTGELHRYRCTHQPGDYCWCFMVLAQDNKRANKYTLSVRFKSKVSSTRVLARAQVCCAPASSTPHLHHWLLSSILMVIIVIIVIIVINIIVIIIVLIFKPSSPYFFVVFILLTFLVGFGAFSCSTYTSLAAGLWIFRK